MITTEKNLIVDFINVNRLEHILAQNIAITGMIYHKRIMRTEDKLPKDVAEVLAAATLSNAVDEKVIVLLP